MIEKPEQGAPLRDGLPVQAPSPSGLGHSAGISSAAILKIWQATKGRAWEPRGGTKNPQVRRLIDAGYVRVCDMRFGFEAMKDAGLCWTEAGKIAAKAIEASAFHAPEKNDAMTQETLREAVISAIEGIDAERQVDDYATEFLNGATDLSEWEREVIADAAIATMFERLRTPSEGIADIGGKRLEELEGDWMSDNERAVGVWQAMLAAFQQENSDGR